MPVLRKRKKRRDCTYVDKQILSHLFSDKKINHKFEKESYNKEKKKKGKYVIDFRFTHR